MNSMSTQNSVYEDAYYDPKAQGEGQGETSHYTFKEGLKIRLPGRGDDDKTYLHIMPAFGDYSDPLSWIPYRDHNPPPPREPYCFTPWIRAYDVWEWVGGSTHIIDASSIDRDARINPVKTLWDHMSRNPEYCALLGRTPDGKKNQAPDAFKHCVFRPKSKRYVFNAVNRAKVTEGESNISCLYTVPRTAVAGGGRDTQGWGLFAALELQQRGIAPDIAPNDYAKRYYWGDITDPNANYPVVIYKAKPPTGSAMKLYNMIPAPDAQPVVVPFVNGECSWFSSRTPLRASELFVDYDAAEVTEILIGLFSDKAPRALIRAFETTLPGINERILKATGLISNSRVHQAGIGAGTAAPRHGDMANDDYIPGVPQGSAPPPPPSGNAWPSPPASAAAPSQAAFAPPAATMPPPPSGQSLASAAPLSPPGFHSVPTATMPPPPMAANNSGALDPMSPEALKAQLEGFASAPGQ